MIHAKRKIITANQLISLGFRYKMNIYSKDGLSLQFYKNALWKLCYGKSPEYDVDDMLDVYKYYLEFTGHESK